MDELDAIMQEITDLGDDFDPSVFHEALPADVSSIDWSKLGQTALSKLMDPRVLTSSIAALYGQDAAKKQSNSQNQIASDLLRNADPYKDYRQQVEIPFRTSQLPQYINTQNKQNSLLDTIMGKASAADPAIEALKQKLLGTNALGGDYAEYQRHLKDTFNDPMQYYNSKGYQTIADLFGQQIARRDAAHGRNSQYGTRAVEMQGNFLNKLNDLRGSLNSAAQTAGTMQGNDAGRDIQGIQALSNMNNQQLQGLTSLYGSVNQGLNHMGNMLTPSGTAGAGATQAAGLQGTAALNNNYQYLPVLDSLVKSIGG